MKKKHPSVIQLIFIVMLIFLCCGLVSCKAKMEEPPITETPVETPAQEIPNKPDPQIVMSTQYYDSIGNYIEIPTLVMPDGGEPNEAISAINLALAEIQEQYQVIPDVVASNQQCFFYPTETDRYINLLLFRTRFFTDLNTGHTVSFVYDKKENRQVTMEDALALVGLTEQDLFHALSAQYDPGYAQSYPNANICIQNHALEAFRLNRDDQPIFYLTARTDDADDTVQDAVSGANHLYIWADGVFTIYEQYNIGEEYSEGRIYPLISAEETVTMDPPLWNQWYFSGDEPDGGFTVIPIPDGAPSDEPLTYDIGKTLSELKNEYPEGEFIVSLDGFPDSAAACFGQQGAEYVYFFFGGHDGDFEKAMDECEEQIKCAGFITTANILFTDMEDDMSFQDFFSLIGVDDYEYFGEDTITAEGWLRFTYNGMEVMVNTNEVNAGGGWDFTGAEIVKRNAPVSIVDPEILNTNQDLAEAVMFDQFDTSEEIAPFDEPLTYLQEKLNTLAPNTPLVVDDIWEFNWNGTGAIVVHATNVKVTGNETTLYNPGDNHVAPNPPGTDNTVMYTLTTLFVDGCDPVELYYWAYPISSDPGGVSYLPATSGSFQQLYTVTQYAANGQPISCPVFMDHGGELVVRYFKYSPTYFQKDINADGIAEFIFSLDRDSSLMSHYQAYQMIDGAPKTIAITSPMYESVLLGTGEFYLEGNATTLKDYSSYIGADGNTHYRRPEEFCILDLDGDGRTEVVVAINDNQLSLILHESYGTVYGYVRPIRHFNTLTLKQDGTFGWSNSAFYHGIGRLDFSDGTDTVRRITYCDYSENADGSKNEICVVDGERVTYEEYSVAISSENNKPDATWYKLSEENVGLFFD